MDNDSARASSSSRLSRSTRNVLNAAGPPVVNLISHMYIHRNRETAEAYVQLCGQRCPSETERDRHGTRCRRSRTETFIQMASSEM